jgi:hypothetical protein
MAALDDFVGAYLTFHGSSSLDALLEKFGFDSTTKPMIISAYNQSLALQGDQQTALNQAAQAMWTSGESFKIVKQGNMIYSMMNEAIRLDCMDLMAPLGILTRAINKLCLYKVEVFPSKGLCFRGGGMMRCHRDFFVESKTYRVPGFLATSFSEEIANIFMSNAAARGEEPILWTVRLDWRGATNPQHRCLHVNLLAGDEQEFLFVPYSTFTVEDVQWSRRPTKEKPHRVTIFAANDNRAAPEDLPVAPWF